MQVPEPDLGSVAPSVVARNCRAEPLDPASPVARYRSVYFDILSDGSEAVTADVETETPCP